MCFLVSVENIIQCFRSFKRQFYPENLLNIFFFDVNFLFLVQIFSKKKKSLKKKSLFFLKKASIFLQIFMALT